MSKGKSTFVTALVAGMLAAILIGLQKLYPRAYLALIGLLALCGFVCATVLFYRWIGGKQRERAPMLPPVMGRTTPQAANQTMRAAEDNGPPRASAPTDGRGKPGAVWTPNAEWTGSYDEIRAEVQEETEYDEQEV